MASLPQPPIIAAVEGGGTTFVLTIAELLDSNSHNSDMASSSTIIPYTPFKILHQTSISSSSIPPSETLSTAAAFFQQHAPPVESAGYAALGIATFGPVGVNPSNTETYGRILPGSPKKEWRNVDILTPILNACTNSINKPPVYKVDTDVNAPAMAEFAYFTKIKKEPITSLAYVTVGTGVGVGLVINSSPVHGMMHPEGGHVPIVPLLANNDETAADFGYSWGEKSPFHGKNTVEGTTSSVALSERINNETKTVNEKSISSSGGDSVTERENLKNLPDNHPIWDHAANSLANLCTTLTLMTSIEKIILGGGVMNRTILYDKIRSKTKELLNGYLDLPQVTTEEGLRDFIGPSVWSESPATSNTHDDADGGGGVGSGLVGALILAQTAYEESKMMVK